MRTQIICFHGEIRKNINIQKLQYFLVKKSLSRDTFTVDQYLFSLYGLSTQHVSVDIII